MEEKKPISPHVRKYMSELGKKGGAVNKKKGSAYFKWVRRHNRRSPVKVEGVKRISNIPQEEE